MQTNLALRTIIALFTLLLALAGCAPKADFSAVNGTVLVTVLPNKLIKLTLDGSNPPQKDEFQLVLPSKLKMPEAFGSLSGPFKGRFAIHLGDDIALGELTNSTSSKITLTRLNLTKQIGLFMNLSPDGRYLAYTKVTENLKGIMPGYVGNLVIRDLEKKSETVVVKHFYDSAFTWTSDGKQLILNQVVSKAERDKFEKSVGKVFNPDMPPVIKLDIASKNYEVIGIGAYPLVTKNGSTVLTSIGKNPPGDTVMRPRFAAFSLRSSSKSTEYNGLANLPWDPLQLHKPLAIFSNSLLLYPGTIHTFSTDGETVDQSVSPQEGFNSLSLDMANLSTSKVTRLFTIDKGVSTCSIGE